MGINKNFVVRNGLEVANNLLYASDETNRVGINTAIPEYELEVIGDTRLDGAIVSTADTAGVSGQYIKSTGTGWEWDTFPRNRQAEKYTLVASQTRIPATGQFPSFTLVEYELTSVYLDGVKLTSGDYVINPGGDSISLFAAAFGGEEIEIIAHGATSVGTGNTGILGISVRESGISTGDPGRIQILDFVGLGVTLSGRTGLVTAYIDSGGLTDVQSDPSPLLGGYLGLNNKGIYGTGIVTATGFVGDGSELTGITTLIKAGTGIYIDTFSGITTINASASGGSGTGYFDNDQTNPGIHTTSTHVGLGTTNPRFQTEIGPVGAAGTQLWVNGDARVTGILTVGTASITIDGINDEIRIGTSLTLTSSGSAQYTGIVTASGFDGDLVGQHRVFTAGVSDNNDYDLAVILDPTQGGHTYNRFDLGHKLQYNPSTGQLSNLGVTSTRGVLVTAASTFTNDVQFQGNIELGNNDQAIFGAGNDLRIYHDGSNSYIQDQGTGGINIDANPSVTIGQYGTTEEMASFRVGAGVSLNYNNSKKFETISTGATVTGTLFATDINTGIGTLSEVHTGSIAAQDLDNLVLSADNINRFVQVEGIVFNKSNQIYGNGGDIRILGGGGQTSRPNLYLGNGNGCILDAGSTASSGLSLKGGGSNGTVRVDEGDFIVGSNITLARSTGIITATSFVGDGSGLTGVTGTGSGVEIKDNDSAVGTAATINFGTGLSVSAVSAGLVTITASGGGGITEVLNDTSPQLGGNLDLNGRTITGNGSINITGHARFVGVSTFTSNVKLEDDDRIIFGVGEDLQIHHDGTNSYIENNTGNLYLRAKSTENSIVTIPDGSVELYHDNSKKFETTASGVDVTGTLNVSGVSTFPSVAQLTPSGSGVIDIGSASNRWGDAYISDLYLSGNRQGVITLTSDAYTFSRLSFSGFYNPAGLDLKTGNNNSYYILSPNTTSSSLLITLPSTSSSANSLLVAEDSGGTLKWENSPKVSNLVVGGISSATAESGTFTASAGVAYTANTYNSSDFVTAEYTLFFQHSSGIQSQKVLVMDNGTTAYTQEYAIMHDNDLLVSVGATIRSGNVELEWTPETGVSGIVTYRYTRETMI